MSTQDAAELAAGFSTNGSLILNNQKLDYYCHNFIVELKHLKFYEIASDASGAPAAITNGGSGSKSVVYPLEINIITGKRLHPRNSQTQTKLTCLVNSCALVWDGRMLWVCG